MLPEELNCYFELLVAAVGKSPNLLVVYAEIKVFHFLTKRSAMLIRAARSSGDNVFANSASLQIS